jgi:transcriptional regulator with XRE-family HTH domain
MNNAEKTLSAGQCRAARALLDWTREDLAAQSKVSRAAIADFETDKRQVRERTTDDLIRAFEAAGLEFIPENGGGAGIRFRERKAPAE